MIQHIFFLIIFSIISLPAFSQTVRLGAATTFGSDLENEIEDSYEGDFKLGSSWAAFVGLKTERGFAGFKIYSIHGYLKTDKTNSHDVAAYSFTFGRTLATWNYFQPYFALGLSQIQVNSKQKDKSSFSAEFTLGTNVNFTEKFHAFLEYNFLQGLVGSIHPQINIAVAGLGYHFD